MLHLVSFPNIPDVLARFMIAAEPEIEHKKTVKTFVLAICLTTLSLLPSRADDACCEAKGPAVEAKLREIDLTILFKKYEQIQTEKAKAEVQLILLQASDISSESELRASHKRIEILTHHSAAIRSSIERLGKDLALAAK